MPISLFVSRVQAPLYIDRATRAATKKVRQQASMNEATGKTHPSTHHSSPNCCDRFVYYCWCGKVTFYLLCLPSTSLFYLTVLGAGR